MKTHIIHKNLNPTKITNHTIIKILCIGIGFRHSEAMQIYMVEYNMQFCLLLIIMTLVQGGISIKPDQMQAINPILILAFIPFFEVVVYPILNKLRLLRKQEHKLYNFMNYKLHNILTGPCRGWWLVCCWLVQPSWQPGLFSWKCR